MTGLKDNKGMVVGELMVQIRDAYLRENAPLTTAVTSANFKGLENKGIKMMMNATVIYIYRYSSWCL